MNKILITGANGQLGNEVRRQAANFPDFEYVFTDIQELDLSNPEAVDAFIRQTRPKYVINCAAYTAVDVAESDDELARLLNTKVPAWIGKIGRTYDCRIVHISTDYVFDGTGCVPYTEDDMTSPESVYGKTKLNGEIALLKENPTAVVIRTAWLYSIFGNNFVKTMLRLGRERDSLKVVYDQVGTPTCAADLARAILHIISRSAAGQTAWTPGIFHYTNEGVCSWYDFAKAIHEFGGISCRISPVATSEYPTPAKRPSYSVLSKEKIKTVYGMEIPYWRDSLQKCIEELSIK
ncbi:MAG: dTDP-4-dehydrorhamnose reductase [Bacteroidales bacterium]|nr:dTDP-4-dehydrorhamnose reductase [Bacteroidales bacterium]